MGGGVLKAQKKPRIFEKSWVKEKLGREFREKFLNFIKEVSL
jgi:hypothetical protein